MGFMLSQTEDLTSDGIKLRDGLPFVAVIATGSGTAGGTIQASHDGNTWVTVLSVGNGVTDSASGVFPFRFWRTSGDLSYARICAMGVQA